MKYIFEASFIVLLAVIAVLVSFIYYPATAKADSLGLQAESAILVDAETGKILYEKQPDLKLPPASMTKLMTEYLVLEAIEKGEISWDTTTQISDYPYSISADPTFSGVGLIQDKDYTVRKLYEAMAIASDNGTTIALAELIAGSEGEFVNMMNAKAEEMGLPDYQFVNATGLPNSSLGENYPEGTEPDADNLLSARSTALLAYHLVNDFPEALEISSMLTTEFDGKQLENLNWMLPWENNNYVQFGAEGVDGLKTGWTDLAGYCFTGTAERDGRRLISVVMKTTSKEARFSQTEKLLEYGFTQFEQKEIFPAGQHVEDESAVPVSKGKEDNVEIVAAEPVTMMIKEGEQENYQLELILDREKLNEAGELAAPLKKGEKVGEMKAVYDGKDAGYIIDNPTASKVDAVTGSAVEKSNWIVLSMQSIGSFFGNVFSTLVNAIKGIG